MNLDSLKIRPGFNSRIIPKDYVVYHGGGAMKANVEYPVGITYYDKKTRTVTPEVRAILKDDILPEKMRNDYLENILKKDIRYAYFGELPTAQKYSQAVEGCGINCVGAFKTKREIKLLDLSDEWNVYNLIYNCRDQMSASDTIFLGKVYDVIDTDPGKINDYWISPAKMKRFTRRTMRNSAKFLPYDPTKPEYFLIPILLDIAEKSGCDGLFNSSLRSRPAEIILKNPINSLIRYYPDKNDWQHVDANKAFSQLGGMTEFQQLVNDMFSYITTNVDFHAGDLYSHSIWVALYTQSWITNTTNKWNIIRETFLQKFQNYENIKDRIFKMTLLAAFLHDIGKMGGKKIFYDKPDHPNIGYEYLASPKLTLENGNVLDPTILFDKFKDKFGFSDEEEKFMILFVMGIVKNHWSFGDHVRLINSGENVKTAGEKYIRLIKTWWNDKAGVFKDNFLLFQIFIVSLMIVSACDILGSEVYINDDSYKQIADMIKQNKAYENQTIDINAKLDELGLPNMYKTHHGGDSFNKFKIDTAGYNLFVQVSKLL